jgi:hypothetical protein
MVWKKKSRERQVMDILLKLKTKEIVLQPMNQILTHNSLRMEPIATHSSGGPLSQALMEKMKK